jgi:RNA polymerase sigma-70 factor, ECF subfamily
MVPGPQTSRSARLVALPSPTLSQADDATVARAAASGDPRATSVLWDRFSPLVRRMLRRTLGPHAEVDHLLHEVFLRVVRQLGSLPDAAQIKPFVVSVTVRVLGAELRRHRVRRLLSRTRRFTSAARAAEEGPASALTSLYRILDELDAEARLAFTLRHFEGLPIAELASAMDASLSTAKRRLDRASAHVQAAVGRDAAFSAYAATGSVGAAL